MRVIQNRIRNVGIFLVAIFACNSCILDEFKVNEIQMKEDLGMEIVSPLFRGNLEFIDLVHDWDTLIFQGAEPTSFLKLHNDSFISIPSRIIFEPATIIDSFSFLIQGNYSLSSVRLEFTVSNGCPFPLNFQMQFFDKTNPFQFGISVLPPPFAPAISEGAGFIPVETIHSVTLSDQQLESFTVGNRVAFTTWFNSSELINTTDTFLANYPVEISILLYGEVQGKDENYEI